nr:unnamed protein product [Callosobruchus chinensis]
MIEYRPRKLMF